MGYGKRESRGRTSASGLGRGNQWRADGRRKLDRDSQDRKICRHFQQHGSCRFGELCKFSHDIHLSRDGQRRSILQETPDQQQGRADYNTWKRKIKSPALDVESTIVQVWDGALAILNGEEREWKQVLPRDLEDEEACVGRQHIKLLLAKRAVSGGHHTYIQLIRPFLLVITHPCFLDCLSVDIFVGSLYAFIGGTNGTRAIPFMQHVCEVLAQSYFEAVQSNMSATFETTLIAASIALRELLQREYRVRFNDDLSTLIDTMENVAQIMGDSGESAATTIVTSHISGMRAIVARAKGQLVHEEKQQNIIDATSLASTYPRALQVPQERHDNDKKDITKIKIFPTRAEILSDDPVFLPSTDLEHPHFLLDPAERHIDTQFRLLRHDTFGELRDVLGGLMHAVDDNPTVPNLDFGGFRANHYSDACISYITSDNRQGLQMSLSFNQPFIVRKKTASERLKWWEDSKRLSGGVLLSLISFLNNEVQQLFFIVTEKSTDAKRDANVAKSKSNIRATITAELATCDQANVECAIKLSCEKARGLLVEFPGVLPATFVPILENLQDMQRLSRLPFRQWIIPDKISSSQPAGVIDIPPPLYAREPGFRFSLEPLLQPGNPHEKTIKVDPSKSVDDLVDLDQMERRTGLDRGQCRALLAALTREFAFIQGPPGTGKSYLGAQFMKVLMHHKSEAKLGPVVIVCYTNHALDQFLEQLLANGIKKIIRIGGSCKSSALEDHNLRKVSQSQGKTKSESYLLATRFNALANEARRIKHDLGKVHGLNKQDKWSSLKHYLRQNHRQIYTQFNQVDVDGFETVGRHPFNSWASVKAPPADTKVTKNSKLTANDVKDILSKANKNVHELSSSERQSLVRFWSQEVHDHTLDGLYESVRQTQEDKQQITNIHDEIDRRVLEDADVIGLTTTGLARRVSVLKRVRCKVVICEEAGEVMEPHMISTLLPTVEHLIQIGDHEQLRPQINNFVTLSLESMQGASYQLDRSQFERLSKGVPGRSIVPVAQLDVQRRMRPEVSTLIRETIYPGLHDHISTIGLPDVVGMRKNVFWLDHSHLEDNQQSEIQQHKSHSNEWEANLVRALVRHIVRQGLYSSSDIAVLTPYTGQLQQLRSVIRNDFEIVLSDRDQDALEKDGFEPATGKAETIILQNRYEQANKTAIEKKSLGDLLRIATVDNFQGEEAKIIIVSLVRSNNAKKVGFLKTTNRINVLLSRAQHGLYLIGNAETYSNVKMWQKVIDMLRATNAIDNTLELCCPRHKKTPIQVSTPDDFLRFSPEGGCNQPCLWRLPSCGHMCKSKCHSESMHNVFLCPQPCQRLHDPCEHACQKETCGEDCGECLIKLHGVSLPCGHLKDEVPCYLAQNPGVIRCDTRASKVVSKCGHTVEVACFVNVASDHFKCPRPCEENLPCGHSCPGTCGKCTGNDKSPVSHQKCRNLCGRPFRSCNHICHQRCHDGTDCGLCVSACEVRCQHSRCKLPCHQACAPCVEKCTWSCEHQGSCTMPCSAPCNRLPCDERCSKDLSCGHQCPGLCGEVCPEECCQQCLNRQDARVDLLEMKTYAEIDVNETPIMLLGCGHFFTAETLDGMIGLQDVYSMNENGQHSGLADISGALATKIPQCPDCQRPVRQYVTQRYNRVINRAVIDELSKRFLTDGHRELIELEHQVDALEERLEASRRNFTRGTKAHMNTGHGTRETLMTTAKHAQNRRASISKLLKQIKLFLSTVTKRHQPAQKLYEAQVSAVRAKSSEILDVSLASLSVRETSPVKNDQSITLGGRMAQIRTESIDLEDAMIVAKLDESPDVTPIPSATIDKFFRGCIALIKDCNIACFPKIAVEATLCFTKVARLHQAPKKLETGKDEVIEHVDTARALLEAAIELCNGQFLGAKQLKVAAERSLRSFQSPRYEAITPRELALIKKAMLEGRGGMATHSGHWYQCINGHPFAIGECGMPMEQARCPECGAAVGGLDHRAVEGVTRAIDMEH